MSETEVVSRAEQGYLDVAAAGQAGTGRDRLDRSG